MKGVELCICNNCDTILIDENPQVDAKKHKLKGGEQSMVFIESEGDFIWACPRCETDGFLADL
jgi:hypothetical protein